ncbi:hypothetical protein COLO4_30072 [Corchorus olitorius]|uniref:Uncharacterized protein n=1 Tax=Corchorus olitorius TaxID=93759 RepID=A0A1R3HBA0_9ROSI|nr:hypothetical protein COLO4_30072 [Corchorus olitorius]
MPTIVTTVAVAVADKSLDLKINKQLFLKESKNAWKNLLVDIRTAARDSAKTALKKKLARGGA